VVLFSVLVLLIGVGIANGNIEPRECTTVGCRAVK